MIRSGIFFILIGPVAILQAQQLVINGDFEQFTQCPDYVSQIDRATGWSRPTAGTSDYFNACLGTPFSMSVPGNQFGDQPARSGNGYAGFYAFHAFTEAEVPGDLDREYVSRALAAPLVIGKTYSIEFHISLADVSKYGVKHLGALLSVDQPYRPDEQAIEAMPQITSTGNEWLIDKNGWTKISGCFIADSAYAYITIGNFRNAAGTEFTEVETEFPLTYFSYYFVDDVSISAMDPPELGPDISSCDGVTIAVQDPIDGVAYEWNTGGSGASIEVDLSGTYWVDAEIDGCITTDTIEVEIMSPITIEFTGDTIHDFCVDPFLRIELIEVPTEATVQWHNGASGPVITVDHPEVYGFMITAPGRCPFAGSISVSDACEHPVFIPNSFTPNGDGINDLFLPVFDPWTTRLSYSIHDRWGRSIFSSEGEPWSGTDLPIGIYQLIYLAEHLPSGKRTKGSGHITLLR